MQYDHSVDPEMRKRRKPFTNENQLFFFLEHTNTIKMVGLEPAPPEKKFIPKSKRFEYLNDELYLLYEHYTTELEKIKNLSDEFDKDRLKLYDVFHQLNEEMTGAYFAYINCRAITTLFKSIQDLNETIKSKLSKERKLMTKMHKMQISFQDLRKNIHLYLDKVEKNNLIRVEFIMSILRDELETYNFTNVYVFNEEKFKEIRKKMLKEIREDKEIIYGEEDEKMPNYIEYDKNFGNNDERIDYLELLKTRIYGKKKEVKEEEIQQIEKIDPSSLRVNRSAKFYEIIN